MHHKSYEELYQSVFKEPPPTNPLSADTAPDEINISQGNAIDTAPDDVIADTALGVTLIPEPSSQPINFEISPDTPASSSVPMGPVPSAQEQNTDDQGQQTSCINNPQPLDVLTFPNQPRPGTQKLPTTIANINHILTEYGVVARYNVIRKKTLITLHGHVGTSDNADNVAMAFIISLAAQHGLSTSKVPAFVEALADLNLYNPVADWINSKPWDGKDRLSDICETVTEREDYPVQLKNILICKWLLSAVAAALMPSGFKSRGVLTFQGPQGIGKTSWLISLVPDPILRELTVKIDHHLDGANKDSILGAVSHWLVEIGELDSSFKKDIARLKGFLTSNFDKIRRPYAHVPSEYPRRTVFFASVNQADFLVDNTGNSRWWTIPVTAINYTHDIDMQQLFAQLAVDFYKGKEWWLNQTEENLLEECNREHRNISVIREQLLDAVDMQLIGKDGNPAMTATEVLKKLGYNNPQNSKARECAAILRELFGDSKRIHGLNKWRIPLKRDATNYLSINGGNDNGKY